VEAHVIGPSRSTAACVVAAVLFLVARPAHADVMCNDATKLPNPIVVSGSIAFEPTIRQFAARLAAEA